MIRYRLICNAKHEFEAWFGSSSAYDKQAKRGLIECPECGSNKVTKTLMAPGVVTHGRSSAAEEKAASPAPAPEAQQPTAPSHEAAQHAEAQRQLLAMMRHIRAEVTSKAEYVGPKFADEARKIHHKEAEARGIWGEATLKEARELHDDGIECMPLPRLPEDSN